jgi:HPt (histidine-containing phosphotransfer) domain-containing protein
MPAIDPDFAAQLAQDLAPEDLRFVFGLFAGDAEATFTLMETAIAAGDGTGWARALHRLAGGAASVGAFPLEKTARAAMAAGLSSEADQQLRLMRQQARAAAENLERIVAASSTPA